MQSLVNNVLGFVLNKLESSKTSKENNQYIAITKDILKSWEIANLHTEYFVNDSPKHYEVFRNIVTQINQGNDKFDINNVETWLPLDENLSVEIGDHDFDLDLDWKKSTGVDVSGLPEKRNVKFNYNLESTLQKAGLSGGYDFEEHAINVLIPYLDLFNVSGEDAGYVGAKRLFDYLNKVESSIILVHEGRHAREALIETKQEVISEKEANLKRFNENLEKYIQENITKNHKVEYCSIFNTEAGLHKVISDTIACYVQTFDFNTELKTKNIYTSSVPQEDSKNKKSKDEESIQQLHYDHLVDLLSVSLPALNKYAKVRNEIVEKNLSPDEADDKIDSFYLAFVDKSLTNGDIRILKSSDNQDNKQKIYRKMFDTVLSLTVIESLYMGVDGRIRLTNERYNVLGTHPIKINVNHRTHMTFPRFEETSYRVEDVLEVIKNALTRTETKHLLYMNKQTMKLPYGHSVSDYDLPPNASYRVLGENAQAMSYMFFEHFDKHFDSMIDFCISKDIHLTEEQIGDAMEQSVLIPNNVDDSFYYGKESINTIFKTLSKLVQDIVSFSYEIPIMKFYSQEIIDRVLNETYIKGTMFETNKNYLDYVSNLVKDNRETIIKSMPDDEWIFQLNYLITERMRDRTLNASEDCVKINRISRNLGELRKYGTLSKDQSATANKINKDLRRYANDILWSNLANLNSSHRLIEMIEEFGSVKIKNALKKVKERFAIDDESSPLTLSSNIASCYFNLFVKEAKRLYGQGTAIEKAEDILLPNNWLGDVDFKKQDDLYFSLLYMSGTNEESSDDFVMCLGKEFEMSDKIDILDEVFYSKIEDVSNYLVLDQSNSSENKALLTATCVWLNYLVAGLIENSFGTIPESQIK